MFSISLLEGLLLIALPSIKLTSRYKFALQVPPMYLNIFIFLVILQLLISITVIGTSNNCGFRIK